MKLKLLSQCNVKGAEGNPGDTIECKDLKLAEQLIQSRGALEVTDEEKPAKK